MSNPVNLSSPTLPEDVVIGELLKLSKEFRAFYQDEREKITKTVHWIENPGLPEGINAGIGSVVDDLLAVWIVNLRHVPARLEDARAVAHELEHLVMIEEGFPLVIPVSKKYENLAAVLASMIADPVADARLQKFGFDLQTDYDREVAESIHQLEGQRETRGGHAEKIWMFNYVGHMLDWELRNEDQRSNEFQAWFDPRFPRVAARAGKLLTMVKRIGYDTPGKQVELLQEILRRYRLEGILHIKTS